MATGYTQIDLVFASHYLRKTVCCRPLNASALLLDLCAVELFLLVVHPQRWFAKNTNKLT